MFQSANSPRQTGPLIYHPRATMSERLVIARIKREIKEAKASDLKQESLYDGNDRLHTSR